MTTALGIVALCISIFGAYAYGSLVFLSVRNRSLVWSRARVRTPGAHLQALAMLLACTLWFVLHTVIGFRALLGEPMNDDWIDLAALELVFTFPGLIFHTVLLESGDDGGVPAPFGRWSAALATLYAVSAVLAIYFPAAIFDAAPAPAQIGPLIGISVGLLFTATSVLSILVMASRRRKAATRDQRRLRGSMIGLFAMMIGVFLVLTFVRERVALIQVLDVVVRATPLMFLLVSVYFENRFEFYDLVIKRGVLLLLSLAILAAVLAFNFLWIDRLPAGAARPWLVAVLLLPVAMAMPWLHSHVGRLLDRLWFGREFTPVEAVKHVLGAMQQATDERSLVAATESTLSEMFRRKVRDRPRRSDAARERRGHRSSPARIRRTPAARRRQRIGGAGRCSAKTTRFSSRSAASSDSCSRTCVCSAGAWSRNSSRRNCGCRRAAPSSRRFAHRSIRISCSTRSTRLRRSSTPTRRVPTRPSNNWPRCFATRCGDPTRNGRRSIRSSPLRAPYLDVEQARFGRRLEFSIQADPTLSRAQVPSMLLQTLVENAVKHGISRLRTPGRIDVTAARTTSGVTLEVRDTGPGPDAPVHHPPSGESFGLRSVRDRLRGHFGTQASLDLLREGGTTIARIQLPLVEQTAPLAGMAR